MAWNLIEHGQSTQFYETIACFEGMKLASILPDD
jgi:hypothetical protein